MTELAVGFLLTLSQVLGVSATPQSGASEWSIVKNWDLQSSEPSFRAESTKIPEQCRANPRSSIQFPSIIHGSHQVYLDGRKIYSWGDPTFQHVQSFYGSPILKCEMIQAGAKIEWETHSYSKYFARFSFYPRVVEKYPLSQFFDETMNVGAAVSLVLMAFFALIVFWGKMPNSLTISLTLSSLFLSGYFFGSVLSYFGISWTMLAAHRFADFSVWVGMVLFANTLRIQGVLGRKLFTAYVITAAIGAAIILLGKSGDDIQFGTSIPFLPTLFVVAFPLFELARHLKNTNERRRVVLQMVSLGILSASVFNDIFVVLGIVPGYVTFSLGIVGGLLFLTLAVNERIVETYRERDFLSANLEAEVERKTIQLRTKTEELELAMRELKSTQAELIQTAKLASLGTLSAGIAHEINNSLNYVNGSIRPLEKFILSTPETPERSKAQKLMELMKDGLKLTFEIIKSLRTFTGLNQAKMKDMKIQELFESVLAMVRSRLRDGIDVKCEVDPELQAYCNIVGMNQVLVNLIGNALDAMPRGGTLSLRAKLQGEQVEIEVADTGGGIPDAIRDRIFDPFFTTKDVGQGTGLGLHIVKMEIERHQGKISVDSQPGVGTTMKIRFPQHGTPSGEVAA